MATAKVAMSLAVVTCRRWGRPEALRKCVRRMPKLCAARHPACEGRLTAAQILSRNGGNVIGRFSDQSQNGLLDSDRVAAPQANLDGGWRLARADTFNPVFR